MNTKLREKAKNTFEKDLFKLINTVVFEKKTVANVKKHGNIKLVTCKKKLFGVTTKLPFYKGFHKKIIGNRNEKNSNTYE